MSTTTATPSPDISKRELVISRVLAVSRERVYQAWTRHLPEWWGPHGMTTPVCEMDLRAGGIFRTVMRAPDGKEYPTRGSFLEVVPNERLVFSDAYEPGWQPAADHFMTAIVTFEALPDARTRYTARVRHKSVEDRKKHEQMGFHQGWGETIDRLAAIAARI